VDAVKNCLRHRRYDTEDEAKERLRELKLQARNRTLNTYPCKVGGTAHWHIGNPYYRRTNKRRRKRRRLAMSVAAIMTSIAIAILGCGVVGYVAYLARGVRKHQRELAAKRGDPGSQQALEDYIRDISQATTDEEITRLDQKRKG